MSEAKFTPHKVDFSAACTKSEFLLPCKTLAHKRRMKYYLTLHAPCEKAGERYKDQVSMMESTTTTLKLQPSTASKYSKASVFSAASSRRWPGQKLATRPSTQSLTNKHVYYKGPKFARRRAQKQFPTNFSPAPPSCLLVVNSSECITFQRWANSQLLNRAQTT